MAVVKLDCKGLNCPMPIVMISKAFKNLNEGDTLEVEASDPAFKADVEAWVRKTGQLLEKFEEGNPNRAYLKKVI
jgi:TusA-related sulfurtransferase